MTIGIVTDSACDLPDSVIDEFGIRVVPLTIRFGDEEFVDRDQLSVDEFWKRMRDTSATPETAAPSAGAFEQTFRALAAEDVDGIVCVNLSSGVSATMQSATVAADAVADAVPVRVVDSKMVSLGTGMLVLDAARAAQDGESLEEIASRVEEARERMHLYATLDTLEFLKRGGRIGGARAMLGSLLAIKPLIEVRNGVVEEAGKVRTRAKALSALAEHVKGVDIDQIAVIGGDAADVGRLRELIEPLTPNAERFDGTIGPVVGTHAGPGVVGIAFRTRA